LLPPATPPLMPIILLPLLLPIISPFFFFASPLFAAATPFKIADDLLSHFERLRAAAAAHKARYFMPPFSMTLMPVIEPG
jgi:hypothetical protein